MVNIATPSHGDPAGDLTLRSLRFGESPTTASARRYPSGRWSVIEVAGEVDLSVTPVMHELLDGAPSMSVVFDLRRVTFMDASGLSVLAAAWRRAQPTVDASVRLVGPTRGVRKVLAITGFDKAMEIYESMEEAIGY